MRCGTARWLFVLVAMLTTGSSIVWMQVRSPTYKATAEVVATPLPQDDPALVGIQPLPDPFETTRTLQTAAGLLRSEEAARATARRVGRGYTARRVLEDIEVEPRGESNLLAVVASAQSPALAAEVGQPVHLCGARHPGPDVPGNLRRRIASLQAQLRSLSRQSRTSPEDATLEASIGEVSQRVGRLRELVGVLDTVPRRTADAQLPTSASGAPQWLVASLAAVFGLALGCGAALLRSAVDRRLTEEDESAGDLPRAHPGAHRRRRRRPLRPAEPGGLPHAGDAAVGAGHRPAPRRRERRRARARAARARVQRVPG